MTAGLLWFDDSKSDLKSKIEKAVAYYQKKYNATPNECLVHPSMLQDGAPVIEGMSIKPYRPVLPGHLWIGIKE